MTRRSRILWKWTSSKSVKRGADRAKHKPPCNKCKQLDQWAGECAQNQQHERYRGDKSAEKKNADAFPVHVMGASRASIVDANSCTVIAVRHGTVRRTNVIWCRAQSLTVLKRSCLARKMCWCKRRSRYDKSPDVSQRYVARSNTEKCLLSARCKRTFILRQGSRPKRLQHNLQWKKEVVICKCDGTIAGSVKLVNDL